jgi:phosphatidylserine/phosphatidylglycerophosphate/cardiolipin synthase-like enzyme
MISHAVIRCGVLVCACVWLSLGAGCATTPTPEVCFSPGGHCAAILIRDIATAHQSIYVQAYGFTHASIAQALIEAHHRGVDVEILLDKSNLTQASSEARLVAQAGIPTYIDALHPIAHNKVMVIDRTKVVTGSFNFTHAADEKNAENLLVLRSVPLAREYIADWQRHRSHSAPYSASP